MKRLLLIALLLLLIGAAACNQPAKGLGDSPVGRKNSAPREITMFPDQYANVANACDGHGHRIFVTTRNAPPVVIPDPSCGQ